MWEIIAQGTFDTLVRSTLSKCEACGERGCVLWLKEVDVVERLENPGLAAAPNDFRALCELELLFRQPRLVSSSNIPEHQT